MLGFCGLVVFVPLDVFRLRVLGGTGLAVAGPGLALFALGWTVIALVPLAVLVLRVRVEERLLHRELPDYADYARAVRWRLVPGVW